MLFIEVYIYNGLNKKCIKKKKVRIIRKNNKIQRRGFFMKKENKDKGITVSCGCFLGTIAEFRAKVTDTHGNNKHAKMYNLAADMAELQILGEEYFDKLNTNKSEPF